MNSDPGNGKNSDDLSVKEPTTTESDPSPGGEGSAIGTQKNDAEKHQQVNAVSDQQPSENKFVSDGDPNARKADQNAVLDEQNHQQTDGTLVAPTQETGPDSGACPNDQSQSKKDGTDEADRGDAEIKSLTDHETEGAECSPSHDDTREDDTSSEKQDSASGNEVPSTSTTTATENSNSQISNKEKTDTASSSDKVDQSKQLVFGSHGQAAISSSASIQLSFDQQQGRQELNENLESNDSSACKDNNLKQAPTMKTDVADHDRGISGTAADQTDGMKILTNPAKSESERGSHVDKTNMSKSSDSKDNRQSKKRSAGDSSSSSIRNNPTGRSNNLPFNNQPPSAISPAQPLSRDEERQRGLKNEDPAVTQRSPSPGNSAHVSHFGATPVPADVSAGEAVAADAGRNRSVEKPSPAPPHSTGENGPDAFRTDSHPPGNSEAELDFSATSAIPFSPITAQGGARSGNGAHDVSSFVSSPPYFPRQRELGARDNPNHSTPLSSHPRGFGRGARKVTGSEAEPPRPGNSDARNGQGLADSFSKPSTPVQQDFGSDHSSQFWNASASQNSQPVPRTPARRGESSNSSGPKLSTPSHGDSGIDTFGASTMQSVQFSRGDSRAREDSASAIAGQEYSTDGLSSNIHMIQYIVQQAVSGKDTFEKMRDDLRTQTEKASHLEEENERLRDQIQELRSEMGRKDEQINGLQVAFRQQPRLQEEYEELRGRFEDLQAELSQCQQQFADQSNRLTDAQERETNLTGRKAALEREVESLKARLYERDTTLQETQATLECDISCLTEERDALRTERETVTARIRQLERVQEELDTTRNTLQTRENENELFAMRLREKTDDLADLQGQRNEQASVIQRLEQDKQQLQGEVEVLQGDLQTKTSRLTGLEDSFARLTPQLVEKEELERRCQEVETQLGQWQEQCQQHENSLQGTRDRIQELEMTLNNQEQHHQREVLDLKSRMYELTSEIDQLRVMSQQVTSERDTFRADCDRLNISVEELTEETQQLQEERDRLNVLLARTEEEKERLATHCSVLEGRVQNAEARSVAYGKQTATAQMQAAQFQTLYTETERQHKDSVTASSNRIKELEDRMRERERQVLPLEMDAQRARMERDNICRQFQERETEISSLKITNKALTSEVEKCRKAIEERDRMQKQMTEDMNNQKEQKLHFLRENKALKEQIKRQEDEIKRLRLRPLTGQLISGRPRLD